MRLFVAVDLSDDVRNRIYRVAEKISGINGIKTVERENLHITLLFLGEVSDSKADVIKNRLREIKFEPFEVKFRGIGYFPPRGNVRVVWVGVSEGVGELRKLADEVYAKLKKLGFRRDKEFAAHVTVARVKRKVDKLKDMLKGFEDEEFGSMTVDKFKLKQSILRPTGPVYKDVEVFGP